MITPEFLESCPDRLEQLYAQAEADIIADMARKLQKYDYYSSAVEWQALKLKEMGLSQKDIYDRLAKASGKTKTAIKNLMKQAGATVLKDDDLRPTDATINALNVGLQKTMGSFENLTRSTATQGSNQLIEMMDRAYMQVTSGAFSPDQAIKNAVEQLAKEGIRSYNYGTRTDHIDVVVRRAVRTGINQTAGLISLNNAAELGTDLLEVTAHSGARPSHAEWQGKVYSISGKTKGYQKLDEATGYGSVTGLMGANCRHSFHPFFEGDERAYSDEELAHIDDKKYTYNGQEMSEYEATQKQRYIERQIRRWKREEAGMAAIGESTEEAKAKIKEWQKTQADFITQTGLKRQYAREQIPTGKTILPTIEKSNTGANRDTNGMTSRKLMTKTKTGEIPSMDEKRFEKIKSRLNKQGIDIIQDADGDDFLRAMNAEALTLSDGSGIIFQSGKIPSVSAVMEEAIHVTQIRKGGVIGSDDYAEYIRREIEANEKVLKNRDIYGLTDFDVQSIQRNLEYYYQERNKLLNG